MTFSNLKTTERKERKDNEGSKIKEEERKEEAIHKRKDAAKENEKETKRKAQEIYKKLGKKLWFYMQIDE